MCNPKADYISLVNHMNQRRMKRAKQNQKNDEELIVYMRLVQIWLYHWCYCFYCYVIIIIININKSVICALNKPVKPAQVWFSPITRIMDQKWHPNNSASVLWRKSPQFELNHHKWDQNWTKHSTVNLQWKQQQQLSAQWRKWRSEELGCAQTIFSEQTCIR